MEAFQEVKVALLPRVLRLLTALLQRLLLFWLLFPLTMADPDPDPNPDSGGDGFSLLGANGSLPLSQYVTMSPLPCEEGERVCVQWNLHLLWSCVFVLTTITFICHSVSLFVFYVCVHCYLCVCLQQCLSM